MYSELKVAFMEALKKLGNKATNKALISVLGVEPSEYLEAREELKAEGRIRLGRGRGGVVFSREGN